MAPSLPFPLPDPPEPPGPAPVAAWSPEPEPEPEPRTLSSRARPPCAVICAVFVASPLPELPLPPSPMPPLALTGVISLGLPMEPLLKLGLRSLTARLCDHSCS